MIKDLAIIVNTHSSCSDIWNMFFGQFEKFFPNQKIYVFTNREEGLPNNCIPVVYSDNDKYRTQYLQCIKNVKEKYCLTLNEDYILYSNVNIDRIKYCIDFLEKNQSVSFVRLMKGVEYYEPEIQNNIYLLSNKNMWFFSQTSTIWNTRDLEKVHYHGPDKHIGIKGEIYGHFESEANEVCKQLDLKGVFYYSGENKRGENHYDSSIFPHIATALVKGRWNISEYMNELLPLIEEYKIDIKQRQMI